MRGRGGDRKSRTRQRRTRFTIPLLSNAKFPYRNLNCKTASEDDYSCKNRPRPSSLAPMISPPPARKSKTLIATSANKQTKGGGGGGEKRLESFKQKREILLYAIINALRGFDAYQGWQRYDRSQCLPEIKVKGGNSLRDKGRANETNLQHA